VVTGEVCSRLAGLGHQVRILGWWSDVGETHFGIEVYPCPIDPAAAVLAIGRTVRKFKPHYLIILGDIPWVSYLGADDFLKLLRAVGTKWCLYYPVDGTLIDGSLPAQWARVLSRTDIPVTMSSFGAVASARSGITAEIIPHGCNTDLFRPPRNKSEAKRRFGYEQKFVILSDVRNHRRKLIPRALDIIRRLRISDENFVFHLHTNTEPKEDLESYCYDLTADIKLMRPGLRKSIRSSGRATRLSTRELANLYAAADVHLLTSFGEGFGLPTLQAASAGVVPVVPANSANIELVRKHGFAVPCDSCAVDEFGVVRKFIDRAQAALVLQKLYDDPRLLQKRSQASRQFALDFSWDRVARQWDILLRQHITRGEYKSRGTSKKSRASVLRIRSHFVNPQQPRPTGHDVRVLPVPWIGVPTRLELRRRHALTGANAVIIVEASHAARLRVMTSLFPGTQFIEVLPCKASQDELQELVGKATLVIDPGAELRGLDRKCVVHGVNYLGKSWLWPGMGTLTRSLLHKARLLLTDYPLSERRLSIARRRLAEVAAPIAMSRAAVSPRPAKAKDQWNR
jgi:glycosyltransferase involved in cell wall biosynthesis